MDAELNGKVYPHPMIAERQREALVSITALRMMQEHHGNRYLSFRCVRPAEEAEWLRKANETVPSVQPSRVQETEHTLAGGWCKHCGCGNDVLDYRHLPNCNRPARAVSSGEHA